MLWVVEYKQSREVRPAMKDLLDWDIEDTVPPKDLRYLLTDDTIERLFSRLGFLEEYTVDFGSDEIVTVIWNEESGDGPDLIIMERDDILVTDLFIKNLGMPLSKVEEVYMELLDEERNK